MKTTDRVLPRPRWGLHRLARLLGDLGQSSEERYLMVHKGNLTDSQIQRNLLACQRHYALLSLLHAQLEGWQTTSKNNLEVQHLVAQAIAQEHCLNQTMDLLIDMRT